jgi:hypothetical protein
MAASNFVYVKRDDEPEADEVVVDEHELDAGLFQACVRGSTINTPP